MFDRPSNTYKQQPEDRSTTFNNMKHLQTNARRPLSNRQTTLTNLQSLEHLCVCAPVGRTALV
eukprot:7337988-Heterocapsa_arctica.AAC.1